MKIKEIINVKLSLEKRKSVTGYLYITPFIIGFFLFFLTPFLLSIRLSLSELEITSEGFNLDLVGLSNFSYAFFEDVEFVRIFTETSINTILTIPMIIIFSFFVANILDQEFRGRLLARVIFFLPVIIGAGVITRIQMQDEVATQIYGMGAIFENPQVESVLMSLRFPEEFLDYILDAINQVPMIINRSAIPILIFLAGLQSIPGSLFEAAKIEGATGWESFWKITFPLLSPLFLTNIVYIIIDSFIDINNQLVEYIQGLAWGRRIYGVSVAMTWIYFGFIIVFLIIVVKILNRYVVYIDE